MKLRCIWCEKELKNAPEVINPFVEKGGVAICFRCIALLNTIAWKAAIHHLTITMHERTDA